MTTVTAHYAIQKQEAETFCEDQHPVRLGRRPEHFAGEPWEREQAIREGKRGYLCPGGEVRLLDRANDDMRGH